MLLNVRMAGTFFGICERNFGHFQKLAYYFIIADAPELPVEASDLLKVQ